MPPERELRRHKHHVCADFVVVQSVPLITGIRCGAMGFSNFQRISCVPYRFFPFVFLWYKRGTIKTFESREALQRNGFIEISTIIKYKFLLEAIFHQKFSK
jgi:hypothetical protein